MEARRVVTGVVFLSPVGNDKNTFFSNLMAGKSGIKNLQTDFVELRD